MKTYKLFWAPTGEEIAVVMARSPKAARRKAPLPWRKYLGEIYVEEIHHA